MITVSPRNLLDLGDQQLDLLLEALHHLVPFAGILSQCGFSRRWTIGGTQDSDVLIILPIASMIRLLEIA